MMQRLLRLGHRQPRRPSSRLECFVLLLALAVPGCQPSTEPAELRAEMNWEQILAQARGQTVRLAMWDGDPMINAYMRDYVTRQVEQQYGIQLELIGGQGNAIVNKLMVDLETGRQTGDVDLMWINGETFYQLRKLDALYGPYTQRLPNESYIDWDNPFVAMDFQQPVNGYECPWGNVQLALIYNSQNVAQPPRTLDELTAWIKNHPGRFTFDNSFTGMTFLKSLLYLLAGGPESLHGPFDQQRYLEATGKLWAWLREVQPYLWRNGQTFPESVAQLHQLFSHGEVDFTMSNNDGEVDNKVLQGILPESARAYVLESGTIRNSHYLGIPVNAPHKAGALVIANFLISPEAQYKKAMPSVWGDGTILAIQKLPPQWQEKFRNIPGRERVPPREKLESQALMEPAPEFMVRLHQDFRRKIIEHAP